MIVVNTLSMVEADLTLGHKSLLTATQRARWDVAVLEELAAPCAMELAAIVDALGSLIDFEWHFADSLATLTLGNAGADLSGIRLTQLPDQSLLAALLFSTYASVWQSSQPQSVQVTCGDWSGEHDVCRSATGVSVRVTSSAAVLRHMVAERHLQARHLQASHLHASHLHTVALQQPDGELSP